MKAEHALAIRAFDYFAALTFGVAAALAARLLVPDLFLTPLAMVAGMSVGMVAAFPLLGLFMYILGGFEIIVMSMQIGMLAGMIGVVLGGASALTVVLAGAGAGLVIQLLLDAANQGLRGEVHLHD
jgi:hypothetical protein